MNARYTLLLAGVSGALAVGLGAFGAHSLESMLVDTGRVETYETAVKYHFYHSLLMMMLGILRLLYHEMSHIKTAIHCCIAGIFIFSGSLYLLCITGTTWLGAVTPVGGLLLISAWLLTGVGAWKHFK